jgi:DNA polymerase III subunit chi
VKTDVAIAEHWFYHLERSPLNAALVPLLEKVLQRGWRALVCSADEATLAEIDQQIWTMRPDSFLPHGLSTEPRADQQPVLLTTSANNENNAQIIILVHGAEPPDLEGVERCITLFDGADQGALGQSRQRWKTAKAQGAAVSYWRQDGDGRWAKQG